MFTFDYNGNILTQQCDEGSTLVDNLSYQYATNSTGQLLSNRLYSVDDAETNASLSATDMEDMPAYINASPNASNNYKYTQIGELKSDNQEEIQEIVWRVDSKISEITRTSGSAKKNLKFEYDAMGNRVAKHVYAGSVLESSTYYVRDAQGNVMGVYEHKMDAENAVLEYRLIERNIYGSAQVGICKDTVDLNITSSAGALTQATYYHARQLNHRQYSLSNHLGNVLTTIGDGKAPVDSNSDGVIDYFTAYIISVSDYSPFGVELANRTWSIEEYRSGFQKQEKDKELWEGAMYYKYRVEDPRLGRFFSVDPLYAKYPYNSNYAFSENVVINAVELEGLEKDDINKRKIHKNAERICKKPCDNKSNKHNYSPIYGNDNDVGILEKWGIVSENKESGYVFFSEKYTLPRTDEGSTFTTTVNLKGAKIPFVLNYDMYNVADDYYIYGEKGNILDSGFKLTGIGSSKNIEVSENTNIKVVITPSLGTNSNISVSSATLQTTQVYEFSHITKSVFGIKIVEQDKMFGLTDSKLSYLNDLEENKSIDSGIEIYSRMNKAGLVKFKTAFPDIDSRNIEKSIN